MEPLVSIVCVSHGRRELLLKCVASCFDQDWPNLEVIVILNPAEPETEAELGRRFPATRVLRTHRNIGFFPALNLGIANCNGEFVMTVDDDAWFLGASAIRRLVEAFAAEPSLGAATCNLEGPNEKLVDGPDRYIREFTTGFTMMPRSVFSDRIGFYPDVFFRSAGETYACSALWDMGHPVKRLTGVRMHHEWAGVGRSKRDQFFFGLRSQLLCALMRDPLPVLLPVLLSKLARSAVFFARRGMLSAWVPAVSSACAHAAGAWLLRRPIRLATWRLMRFVDRRVVTDLAELERRFEFCLANGR